MFRSALRSKISRPAVSQTSGHLYMLEKMTQEQQYSPCRLHFHFRPTRRTGRRAPFPCFFFFFLSPSTDSDATHRFTALNTLPEWQPAPPHKLTECVTAVWLRHHRAVSNSLTVLCSPALIYSSLFISPPLSGNGVKHQLLTLTFYSCVYSSSSPPPPHPSPWFKGRCERGAREACWFPPRSHLSWRRW